MLEFFAINPRFSYIPQTSTRALWNTLKYTYPYIYIHTYYFFYNRARRRGPSSLRRRAKPLGLPKKLFRRMYVDKVSQNLTVATFLKRDLSINIAITHAMCVMVAARVALISLVRLETWNVTKCQKD